MNSFSASQNSPADSRQRLLLAARDLFAQGGYHGVSVSAIVCKAGLSQRMVYHYFQSKQDLYHAVLEQEYGKLAALELDTLSSGQRADRRILDILRAYFAFLKENPAFVRLLLWENLQRGANVEKARPQVSKGPMLELLRDTLEQGRKEGILRKDLDAAHLLVHLIGLCLTYFSNRYTLSSSLGLDLGSEKVLQEGMRQAGHLLMQGIRA